MRWWLVVVMLAACGGKSDSPPPGDDKPATVDDEIAAVTGFATHVTTAVDGANGDCAKLDAAVTGLPDQSRALAVRVAKLNLPPLTAHDLGAAVKGKLDAAATKLSACATMPTVQALINDPSWAAIQKRAGEWIEAVATEEPKLDATPAPADAAVADAAADARVADAAPADAAVEDAGVDAGVEPNTFTPKPEWGFLVTAEHEPTVAQKKLDTGFGKQVPTTAYVGFATGTAGMLQVLVYDLPAKWKKQKAKAVYAQLEADIKAQKAKLDGAADTKVGKEIARDVKYSAGKTLARERWLFRNGKLYVARATWTDKGKGAAAFAKQGEAFVDSFALRD